MVLLDARAYSIKFVATRKKVENEEKLEIQNRLEDAVRLLELDKGQDTDHTNELMDNINTLKNTIQARNDYEEEEKARKYMAQKNLEAETPTKAFCNQINKAKKEQSYHVCFKRENLQPKNHKITPLKSNLKKSFVRQKLKPKLEISMLTYTTTDQQTLTKMKLLMQLVKPTLKP